VDTLKEILRREMQAYAVVGLNGYSNLTTNTEGSLLTIISTAIVNGQRLSMASLIARLEQDAVIIEHDVNSKPLVDALLQAGVPRERIILAYAGEPVPEAMHL
jgi:hypothetical protein